MEFKYNLESLKQIFTYEYFCEFNSPTFKYYLLREAIRALITIRSENKDNKTKKNCPLPFFNKVFYGVLMEEGYAALFNSITRTLIQFITKRELSEYIVPDAVIIIAIELIKYLKELQQSNDISLKKKIFLLLKKILFFLSYYFIVGYSTFLGPHLHSEGSKIVKFILQCIMITAEIKIMHKLEEVL